MPAIVGSIKLTVISTSGVMNIGDVQYITPTSYSKIFAGSGSFVTGYNIDVKNGHNVTYTIDNNEIDDSIIGEGL
ncbi:spore germination protein [Fictibacillus sp. Mic-4]|uniref:spore germination protein n=1 Tax=Fictibacillus sp. Mic-4 TaxID=3132826 RepID=UPI003CEC0C90